MPGTELQDQVAATIALYEAAMAPGVADILRASPELKPLSTKFAELTRALMQHRLIDRNVSGWPVIRERVKDISGDVQAGVANIGYGIVSSGDGAEAMAARLSSAGPKGSALLAALRDATPLLDTPTARKAASNTNAAGAAASRPLAEAGNASAPAPDTRGLIPVSIIGTAGRKDDAVRINRPLYDAMVTDAETRIRQNCADEPVRAVSGGAAVADHVAVSLFLKGAVKELTLHLPAKFENGRFVETPGKGNFDPARTANYYHRQFKEKTGIDGLAEIATAMKTPGCTVEVTPGFKERNTLVAREGRLLVAYTFGDGAKTETLRQGEEGYASSSAAGLKDGGTADTWQKSGATIKVHVPLHLLEKTRHRENEVPPNGKPLKELKGYAVEVASNVTSFGQRRVCVYLEQPDRPGQSLARAVVSNPRDSYGPGPAQAFENELRTRLSAVEKPGELLLPGQNVKVAMTFKGNWRKDEFKKNDGTRAESWRFDVKDWSIGRVMVMGDERRESAGRTTRGSGEER